MRDFISKKDLIGKIVLLRRKGYCFVTASGRLISLNDYHCDLSDYTDELLDKDGFTDYDIIEVFEEEEDTRCHMGDLFLGEDLTKVWERFDWNDHIGEKVVAMDTIGGKTHRGYLRDYVEEDYFPFKVLIEPGDDFLGVEEVVKPYRLCELYEDYEGEY